MTPYPTQRRKQALVVLERALRECADAGWDVRISEVPVIARADARTCRCPPVRVVRPAARPVPDSPMKVP